MQLAYPNPNTLARLARAFGLTAAVKLLGYYQQQPANQPITESSKITAPKIGMGNEAIITARGELEFFGLIKVNRPTKNSVSIDLLINY